jgi:hypothetical protein
MFSFCFYKRCSLGLAEKMNAGTGYSSSEESRVEWNGSISLKNEGNLLPV